jgi:hypothetical protein
VLFHNVFFRRALMKSVVTLTSSESKRLVGKAIVKMDKVQEALQNGIIAIDGGSSGAYVAEELAREAGTELAAKDLREYLIGIIAEDGSCLEAVESLQLPVFVNGTVEYVNFPTEDFTKYFPRMTENDFFIKGGNAVDINGKAGGLCAAHGGGHLGMWLPHALVVGIPVIIPMTVNKTIPTTIETVVEALGTSRISVKHSHGMAVGMLPMPGIVVREIEAIDILTGAEAIPVAGSGIGSGEGTVTFVIQGNDEQVRKAWDLIQAIKGEPQLVEKRSECSTCPVPGDPFGWGIRCSTQATKARK